ncbi:MAG: sugar phosphate nucleotidyltransferase [bacterium]|nr:sugar phosphate nucleotidyltransferase [bacterium]
MKCIILAAGEGVRMKPLTDNTPKPMLPIRGRPILEYIFGDLPSEIDEVILVVGYLKERIINHFGNKFGRLKLTYVEQDQKMGTYKALELCKNQLTENERFLMLYADDLHGAEGLRDCVTCGQYALLVYEAEDPRRFGVVEIDADSIVVGVEEKPENPKTNLVSTGVMVLDKNIFNFPARQHKNGEYYLTDSVEQMIKAGYKFKAIRSSSWIPIGYPEDLGKAEEIISSKL